MLWTRRELMRCGMAVSGAALLSGCAERGFRLPKGVAISTAVIPPRSGLLAETGTGQRRWLAPPGGWVVLGAMPINLGAPPLVPWITAIASSSEWGQHGGALAPMSVGMYVIPPSGGGNQVVYMPQLCTLRRLDTPASDGTGWLAPLRTSQGWRTINATLKVLPGDLGLQVLPLSGGGGTIMTDALVNLDDFPLANLVVAAAGGPWILELAPGPGSVQTEVLRGSATQSSQAFVVDIPATLGWTGTRTLSVRFTATGAPEPTVVGNLSFGSSAAVRGLADSAKGSWLPWEMGGELLWADGSTVAYTDQFVASDVLVRTCVVQPGSNGIVLALVGATTAQSWQGSVDGEAVTTTWLPADTTAQTAPPDGMLLRGFGFETFITSGSRTSSYAFASDLPTLLARLYRGETTPSDHDVMWGMALPRISNPTTFRVAVAFAHGGNTVSLGAQAAAAASGRQGPPLRSRTVAQTIQNMLASVPHPAQFDLTSVPSLEVTGQQIAATYAAAWSFLYQSTVDARAITTTFSYPQMCVAKPALFNDGAPPAKAENSWDTVLALQAFSLWDAGFAWDCLEGLLGLVGSDGIMQGEALASRVAQTLWIVQQRAPNRSRLAALYPAVKRFLQWKQANPYWVYDSTQWTGGPQKDMEIVTSTVWDQGFAVMIADYIGLKADVAYWREQQQLQYKDIVLWFWDSKGAGPYQYYDVNTGQRGSGNLTWCLTALALSDLPNSQVSSLQDAFKATFRPEAPFGGLHYPKYPDISLLVYGLYDRGMVSEARQLIQCCLRDIVRAGEFAEYYSTEAPGSPQPQGVFPSCFGATQFIEFSLLTDGLRYSQGPLQHVSL